PVGTDKRLTKVKRHRVRSLGKVLYSGGLCRRPFSAADGVLDRSQTVGADAVGEAHRRICGEIFLNRLPVVLIVADLATPGTDGQQLLQPAFAGEGRLQLADSVRQPVLKFDDT